MFFKVNETQEPRDIALKIISLLNFSELATLRLVSNNARKLVDDFLFRPETIIEIIIKLSSLNNDSKKFKLLSEFISYYCSHNSYKILKDEIKNNPKIDPLKIICYFLTTNNVHEIPHYRLISAIEMLRNKLDPHLLISLQLMADAISCNEPSANKRNSDSDISQKIEDRIEKFTIDLTQGNSVAVFINFSGINFEGIVFKPISRKVIPLPHSRFVKANLQNVNLNGAYLVNCNFTQADLRNANLQNADLENADLTGAKLIGTNLVHTNLKNASLIGVDINVLVHSKARNLGTIKLIPLNVLSFTEKQYMVQALIDMIDSIMQAIKNIHENYDIVRAAGIRATKAALYHAVQNNIIEILEGYIKEPKLAIELVKAVDSYFMDFFYEERMALKKNPLENFSTRLPDIFTFKKLSEFKTIINSEINNSDLVYN